MPKLIDNLEKRIKEQGHVPQIPSEPLATDETDDDDDDTSTNPLIPPPPFRGGPQVEALKSSDSPYPTTFTVPIIIRDYDDREKHEVLYHQQLGPVPPRV